MGTSTRDEPHQQLSLDSASDATLSYRTEGQSRIEEVLDWIEGIPLTRKVTTRSIARDFSDAVLMSEILKFYYPTLVSSHNYITANSIQGKRDNWNVLNRKVLAKLEMRLTQDTIEQLLHSHAGTIEKLLLDFRDRRMQPTVERCKSHRIDDGVDDDVGVKAIGTPEVNKEVPAKSAFLRRSGKKNHNNDQTSVTTSSSSFWKTAIVSVFNIFVAFLRVLQTIICFWRWFDGKKQRSPLSQEDMAKQQNTTNVDKADALSEKHQKDDTDIRDYYLKALHDLELQSEATKTLRHKVAFLEGTIKLKDAKISSLLNELDNKSSNNNNNVPLHHHNIRNSDVCGGNAATARLSLDSTAHRLARRTRTQI